MKECFTPKKFNPVDLAMIELANSIMDEYVAQGYDLSLRQLHYQFVARNAYPDDRVWSWTGVKWIRNEGGTKNAPPNYKWLGEIVTDARLAGLMDWDVIKDRNRVTDTVPTFSSLKTYLQQLNESFRLDKWKEQKAYIEVMVEKQALEGVLLPVCRKWEVAFTANKGYSSSSSVYERAKYLQSQRDVEGKEVHVIYAGDHDPSGIDMSRDVLDRLELFSNGAIDVQRVALNIDQVQRLNLPENTAKLGDSRSADYISKFGNYSWELDALNPSTLASIVENSIKCLVDLKSWRQMEEVQQKSKDELQDIIDEMTG